MTPTGENDHLVDEDDSVVSNDILDMGEECVLRAATMSDVSLSDGVAVQENLFLYVCVYETRLALCRVNVFNLTWYVFPPSFL